MKSKILLGGVLLLICSFTQSQTTVDLSASADNTMYAPDGLSNGAGQSMFTGKTSSGNIRRALIKFDISGIPSGSTITDVTLDLACLTGVGGARTVVLKRVTSDWGEGTSDAGSPGGGGATATLNDATLSCSFANGIGGCSTSWSSSGGDFSGTTSASLSVGGPSAYSWNDAQMITDVQNWLDAVNPNYGWIIIGDESANSTAKRFGSRENTTSSNQPVLHVTYDAPLPVTLVDFSASNSEGKIVLSWETAVEENNHYFLLERSEDARNFKTIATLEGAGTSSVAHQYAYTDYSAVASVEYYRLAQQDFDGQVHYSNVIAVKQSLAENTQISFQLVSDEFEWPVEWKNSEGQFMVFSTSGALLAQGRISENTINFIRLSAGFYLLMLKDKKGISRIGLVKE